MAKRKTKEEMKQAIVNAAMNLLDEKSYQRVTMDEIASKAGITKRTLYKYFPSKSTLFKTEFLSYFKEFRENVIETADHLSNPGDRMRNFMKSAFEFTRHRPAYYKLLLMYQANFFDNDLDEKELKELHDSIRTITTGNRAFLEEFWKDSLKAGYFQDKSNPFLFQMLIAMNKLIFIEYYYNRTSYEGNDPSLEEMLKTFSDMIYICANYDMEKNPYNL